MRNAGCPEEHPLSEVTRKTFAHPEFFSVWTHCGTPRAANDWDSQNSGELPHKTTLLSQPNLVSLKNFPGMFKANRGKQFRTGSWGSTAQECRRFAWLTGWSSGLRRWQRFRWRWLLRPRLLRPLRREEEAVESVNLLLLLRVPKPPMARRPKRPVSTPASTIPPLLRGIARPTRRSMIATIMLPRSSSFRRSATTITRTSPT